MNLFTKIFGRCLIVFTLALGLMACDIAPGDGYHQSQRSDAIQYIGVFNNAGSAKVSAKRPSASTWEQVAIFNYDQSLALADGQMLYMTSLGQNFVIPIHLWELDASGTKYVTQIASIASNTPGGNYFYNLNSAPDSINPANCVVTHPLFDANANGTSDMTTNDTLQIKDDCQFDNNNNTGRFIYAYQ